MQHEITFKVRLTALEIAHGRDGFFRGAPDPAVILAAYLVLGDEVLCLGRSLYRFQVEDKMPAVIAPTEGSVVGAAIDGRQATGIVMLATSVEENNGDGVRAIFGCLEHCASISFWALAARSVSPMHVVDMPGEYPAWRNPTPVEMLWEGSALSNRFSSDTWVGAVALQIEPSHNGEFHYRLPFRSQDGRNDWTALARVEITRQAEVAPHASKPASIPRQTASVHPGAVAGATETEWRALFSQFLTLKKQCGESITNVTFEKFNVKLQHEQDALMRRGAAAVKFSVHISNGKATLRATPIDK